MQPIAPGDLRAELLDNPELDLAGPAAFLRTIASEAALPATCVIAITAAIDCLQAATQHLEAAATLAEGLSR